MSFIPQFLNSPAALIAGSIFVPLLVLLYFLKLRRVPQTVPSTLLWKRAVQDLQVNSPFQKLKRNLLLLLQLLVLIALLLALARPVSEGAAIAGEKNVILIDRSASMNASDGDGGSRLQAAKDQAKQLIGTLDNGATAMIITFDDTAQIVQPFTSDTGLLRSAIDDITPTDRPTKLSDAYKQANANMAFDFDALRASEAISADVFLFSDGRVPPADIAELSMRGNLDYRKIGTSSAENVAVVAASAKRNYETPTDVQVFARFNNFGPELAEAQARVYVAPIIDGEELEFRPVGLPLSLSMPPARWSDEAWREFATTEGLEMPENPATLSRRDSIDVQLNLGTAAVVKIELQEGGGPLRDALAADNVAFIVVPPPEPLKVLLVTDGNYFLELLMETQPLDEPEIVNPAGYEALLESGEADAYDMVIFDDYSPTRVPAAGTFVYSGGMPPDDATEIKQVTADDGTGIWFEGSDVLDWERDHPMFAGLSLNDLWVQDGRLLTLPLGTEMLVEGIKGPLLALERNGGRTNLIFSFDLNQSTWPRDRTFPLFGYLMFEYLAAGEDLQVRESVKPGETVRVPQSIVDRAGVGEDRQFTIVGPQQSPGGAGSRDSREYVSDTGIATLGPFESVGLYTTEPALGQFAHVAVSLLDENESNLLPSPTDPGNLSGMEPEALDEAGDGGGGLRLVEWWRWLVAAAAGLLLVEWFVYTRRVSG